MSSDQCAVGPDGQLLPASQIQWFHDPDDPMPLAQPACPSALLEVPTPSMLHRSHSSLSLASSASSANLDTAALLPPSSSRASGHPKPATIVGGVRRITRRHLPSAHLLALQGIEPSTCSLGKRKANSSPGSDAEELLAVDNTGKSDVESIQFKKLCVKNTDTDGSEMENMPGLVDVEDSDDEDDEVDDDGDEEEGDERDEEAIEAAY